MLLADMEITRSHSRPRVSNDNPFSEALFKTLKSTPVFERTFRHDRRSPQLHRHVRRGLQPHPPPQRHRALMTGTVVLATIVGGYDKVGGFLWPLTHAAETV
jgi:transposase InsO family protein